MATSAPLTARSVARRELTAAIVAGARAQLVELGPGQLSVRAVARDLGMASSAVYRYFPSRDDLLTELLVIIYGELADLLETADADVDRAHLSVRWRVLGRTLRAWAVETPHEYALLFGSPVPGYAAPEATIEPAGRVTGVLIAIMAEVEARAPLSTRTKLPAAAHQLYAGIRTVTGIDFSDEALTRALTAWSGLFGALSLELFGHLYRGVDDYAAHFEIMLDRLDPTS